MKQINEETKSKTSALPLLESFQTLFKLNLLLL